MAMAGCASAQQAVLQAGPITPYHSPTWLSNGVIGDGGTPTAPGLSSVNLFNGASCPLSVSSQPGPGATTAPYSRFSVCQTAAATTLYFQGLNGQAPPQAFLNIGGVNYALPASGGGSGIINAGTGLTGGGAVISNPTLSANFGTAAGTIAQGNDSRIVGAAPLASPAFTGSPTAPTQSVGDNSTKLATDAFVLANSGGGGGSNTIGAGTGLTGGGTVSSNPSLAVNFGLVAPLASPALTGLPTAPTQAFGDNSTRIATDAFVLANSGNSAHPLCINVNAYGADPTGAAFSDTAIANAMAAMATDFPCLEFGAGVYKFANQILYTFSTSSGSGKDSFTVRGAGSDNTRLFWPSSLSGGALKAVWNPANGVNQTVNYSGFSLVTGAPNGGFAVTLENSSSIAGLNTLPSTITDVVARGNDTFGSDYWTVGFNISGVSEISWINSAVFGVAATQLGTGWMIGPGSNPNGAVVFNFVNSTMDYLADGLVIGNNTEGYTITGANCTVTTVCITMPSGGADQLAITNSQFESSQVSVAINGTISNVMIQNNLFIVGQSNSGAVGISITPVWVDVIAGNTFNSNGTSTTAVALGGFNGSGATVYGNAFSGTFQTGLLLGNTTQSVVAFGNVFNSVSTPINNMGSSNFIGVTCSGTPSSSFVSSQGIVTHC